MDFHIVTPKVGFLCFLGYQENTHYRCMECHQCQNVIFYFRLTSPIFVDKFCLLSFFAYSNTDISFGYRHFIQIQTFHLDTDILFGYRRFIRIQTFYSNTDILNSNTDILFGYKHSIWIQTFRLYHYDTCTNVLFFDH